MSAGIGTAKVNNDLSMLAPLFRQAVEKAIDACNSAPNNLDAMVYEGYRTLELQRIYYARGRTVFPPPRPVTNAPTNLLSWHGYGLAVDVVHKTKFWNPPGGEEWFVKVANIFKQNNCKWGGDWTHPDTPHFQWGRCKASPSDETQQMMREKGFEAVWKEVAAI